MIVKTTKAALAVASALLFVPAAFAHMTVLPSEAELGSTQRIVVRVPHGCAGEATHTIRVTIPEGFYSVKPMPHAGWTLETLRAPYGQTYMAHGKDVTEGVTEISWSGGDLPDDWYDEFVFRGTFADTLPVGEKFYFPAVQLCANGSEEWTNVSTNVDAGKPAPSLLLIATAGVMLDHSSMSMSANTVFGPLELSGAFTRAMAPNAKSGGGFVTIKNTGKDDDRLIGVSSDAAGVTQLHEMKMDGDVMRMQELANGIEIPAGASVSLAPGGLHIMFMQVKAPFVEGNHVPVTLTFEKAGKVDVMLNVGSISAASAPQ